MCTIVSLGEGKVDDQSPDAACKSLSKQALHGDRSFRYTNQVFGCGDDFDDFVTLLACDD